METLSRKRKRESKLKLPDETAVEDPDLVVGRRARKCATYKPVFVPVMLRDLVSKDEMTLETPPVETIATPALLAGNPHLSVLWQQYVTLPSYPHDTAAEAHQELIRYVKKTKMISSFHSSGPVALELFGYQFANDLVASATYDTQNIEEYLHQQLFILLELKRPIKLIANWTSKYTDRCLYVAAKALWIQLIQDEEEELGTAAAPPELNGAADHEDNGKQ